MLAHMPTFRAVAIASFAAIAVLWFSSSDALAAGSVADVFGDTATLQGLEPNAAVGDFFYAVNAEGKRKAILQITSIEGETAHAKAIAGKAAVGHGLEKRIAKPGQKPLTRAGAKPDAPILPARAESSGEKRVRAGGGVSYFNMNGLPLATASSLGAAVGGWYLIPLSKPALGSSALEAGVVFFQGGSEYSQTFVVGTTRTKIDWTVTLNYLAFPVAVKWDAHKSDSFAWLLKAGAVPAYLAGSSVKSSGGTAGAQASVSGSVSSNLDFSLLLGAELAFRPGGWWVELDYQYGLLSQTIGSASFTNSGFLLMAGGSF